MRSAEILDSGGNATIRLSVWTEGGGGPILRGADTSFLEKLETGSRRLACVNASGTAKEIHKAHRLENEIRFV